MNNSKKKPIRKNQLNSNSNLFLQLGIILALVLVYNTFELKFSKTVFNLPDKTVSTDEPDVLIFNDYEIVKTKTIKNTIKKSQSFKNEFVIDNDPDDLVEQNLLDPEPTKSDFTIDSIVEIIDPIDPDEIHDFKLIEQAPRYPGCKGKDEIELKKCFSDKIKMFVIKKFNQNLISNLDLHGVQKIYVQFEIDKNGDIVDIKARAPYKKLEKEAIKVVSKLPKMIPGKQRDRNVGVRYNLPISLYIN